MLVVSFIESGESVDNEKTIWVGSKDVEISELGERQAKALGEAYANTRLDAIITSDLKCAHITATALLDGQPDPKPFFRIDRDLREQNLGDAEGTPWMLHWISNKSLEDHFKDGQYPVLHERFQKFPNGESLDDLAVRAERFINDNVLKPYLFRAISSTENIHIAVIGHGFCLAEVIQALLKRNEGGSPISLYRCSLLTSIRQLMVFAGEWTRVTVQAKVASGPRQLAHLTKYNTSPGVQVPQTIDGLENLPPLIVKLTDVNQHEHITNLVNLHSLALLTPSQTMVSKYRQMEIIEHDPKQRSTRKFHGIDGAKNPLDTPKPAESKAMDGASVEEPEHD